MRTTVTIDDQLYERALEVADPDYDTPPSRSETQNQ